MAFPRRSDDQDSLLTDQVGMPLDILITGGQVYDCTQAIELLG